MRAVMHARSVARIERAVDALASAAFALAWGGAIYAWLAGNEFQLTATAAIAAPAYFAATRILGAIKPEPRKLPVSIFDVREVGPMELPELLLTERYEASAGSEEALVLDDILAKLGSDSRVVRLFDPAAMPTPGQLNDRIERHLERVPPAHVGHDATQALHDALAELRRSIR